MKFTPWFLAALAPFMAIAYNGYLGHAAVVVLTVGIFLGTLSLGKSVQTTASGVHPLVHGDATVTPVAEVLAPAVRSIAPRA